LVTAQQLRRDAEEQAARQGEGIVRDARIEAERLLSDAKEQEKRVRHDHASAQRQLAGYLAAFRALLERNLAEIDALESSEHFEMEHSRRP